MKLTYKQTLALDEIEDNGITELLFGGGAGGGKSALGCYWQLKRRLKYPGTRGLIGRSSLKTLKETTLKTFFEVAQMQGLKSGIHFNYNQQTGVISFFNGSEILLKDLFLYPSDPEFDNLGSLEITDAFIDEANQIVVKARNIVKSRIRYKLPGGVPKLMMSCNPAKNWAYMDFYEPSINGDLREDRAFVQALLLDNPYLPDSYRSSLEDLDEISRQRLLYGNWDYNDDPTQLMKYDQLVNMFIPKDDEITGKKYITVDPARFGKDLAVIMVWVDLTVIKVIKIKSSSIPELVDTIKELAKEYSISTTNIIADGVGVGGGVVDMLHCKEFIANARPLMKKNYSNLKSQCSYRLAESVVQGKVKIFDTQYRDSIIQELEQIKSWKADSDGKLQIMPKDKVKQIIGRSPDYSDALMMRMYYELKRTGKYTVSVV